MTRQNRNTQRFEELREKVVSSVGGAVEISVADIARDLDSALVAYLGLASLKFQQFQLLEQGDAAVRIAGSIRLPVGNRKADLGVDARFTRAGSDIGYTVVLSLGTGAAGAALGDLRQMLDALPVRMENLWLSLSSEARGPMRIETPGLELDDAVIDAGRGYMFRLGGQLLKGLKLDETLFYLANFPDALKFNTRTSITIPIGPLLQFTIRTIAIEGAQAVSLAGEGAFDFFGQKLAFVATIRISVSSIALEIDLGRFVPQIDHPFFKPLTLTRAVASIEGTLANYAVGLAGDFVISGSGNTGAFLVKYDTRAPAAVPDLFELESKRLILSDLATIATGVAVTVPPLLDRVIELDNTYLYYARKPGLSTLSGIPSVVGVKAHSNVTILGYKAYGEVVAVADKFAGKFQFAPIKLGNVVEISGSGQGSPRGFSGNAVGKNAIMVEVAADSPGAAASLKVRVFGQSSIDAIGRLNESALAFQVAAKMPAPLPDASFSVDLRHEVASLTSRIAMTLDIKADWGGGDFGISKAAQVEVDLAIVATRDGATGRAQVHVSLGPVRLAFPIDFDPLDIASLVKRIRAEAERRVLEALEDAVIWLRAVLDGTIALIGQTGKLAEALGEELRDFFKRSAGDAAAALRQAGYDVNNAYLVLEHAFRAEYEDIRDLLQKAGGYAEEVVVGWLWEVCKGDAAQFGARTVADLMLRAGYGTERAIVEVQRVLKDAKLTAEVIGQLTDSPKEVARFLVATGVSVQHAASYLAEGFYRLTQDALKQTLVSSGYAADEAQRAVEQVWRESGRVISDIRDELSRAWDRYRPRVTIRWRVKW